MRTDLYGLVHKAQRYHLLGFARALSHADLGDAATRERLAAEVRAIARMLAEHADNEERYIHPLFAARGAEAASLEHEHRAIEARIADWVGLVGAERWDELYRSTMRLLGEYLLHIDAEERAQADVLWASYTDAELGAVMARFKTERDPAAARHDLELLIPALGDAELAALLRGLRGSAPPAAVGAALELARGLLEPARWARVAQAISAPERPSA